MTKVESVTFEGNKPCESIITLKYDGKTKVAYGFLLFKHGCGNPPPSKLTTNLRWGYAFDDQEHTITEEDKIVIVQQINDAYLASFRGCEQCETYQELVWSSLHFAIEDKKNNKPYEYLKITREDAIRIFSGTVDVETLDKVLRDCYGHGIYPKASWRRELKRRWNVLKKQLTKPPVDENHKISMSEYRMSYDLSKTQYALWKLKILISLRVVDLLKSLGIKVKVKNFSDNISISLRVRNVLKFFGFKARNEKLKDGTIYYIRKQKH